MSSSSASRRPRSTIRRSACRAGCGRSTPGRRRRADAVPEPAAGLGADRPLVYATLGTNFNDPSTMQSFLSAVEDGLADEQVDLLVTLGRDGDHDAIGDRRPGVQILSFVPQRAVLDRCSVVVCHGGYGTVLDAIDAAVPVVVVPFGADQFVNAAAVERVGIGVALGEVSLSPRSIRNAVVPLLDPRSPHRRRVEALRDEWRALGGPDEAAAAVLALGHG